MSVIPRRTLVFLAVCALGWSAWETVLRLTAPRRIDPALAAALDRGGPVNVAVTLPFAPEDFHIRLFQGYGVVSGVRGTTVLVDRVGADDVARIARHYWVERIGPGRASP